MKSIALFFVLFATVINARIDHVTQNTTYLSTPLTNPSIPTDIPLESSFLVDILREQRAAQSKLTQIKIATGEQEVLATGDFTVASVSSDGKVIVAAAPGALFVYFQSVLFHKFPLTCVFNLCNVTNISVSYVSEQTMLSIVIQSGSGMAFYSGRIFSISLGFRQPLGGVAVVNSDVSMISMYNQTTHSIQFFDIQSRQLSKRNNDLYLSVGTTGKAFNWVISRDGFIVGTTDDTNLYRFNRTIGKWEECGVSSISNVAAFSPNEEYIVFGNGYRMSRFLLTANGCGHQEWAVTSNQNKPYTKLWVSDSTTTAVSSGFGYSAFTVYNYTLDDGSVCAHTRDCPQNMICNATSSKCALVPLLVPVTTLEKSQSVYIVDNNQGFLTPTGFVDQMPSEADWRVEEQNGGVYSVSTEYRGVNSHLYTDPQIKRVMISTGPIDIWSTFYFQKESSGRWTIRTAADDSLWRNSFGSLTADGVEGNADTLFEMAVFKIIQQ